MTGAKFPSVRLSPMVPAQGDDGGGVVQDGVVVDLPASNKFGITWPAEPTPVLQPPERPSTLSSSEGESELSEEETASNAGRQYDDLDGAPSSRIKSCQVEEDVDSSTNTPRFSRAFSMPLPSEIGYLRNPRRNPPSPEHEQAQEHAQFHELSLELADSVQMMVQTLLQVSPPQVLDSAKEQFSACSLSIPTPSLSAIFTTMKNLNYISANMPIFCLESLQLSGDSSHTRSFLSSHSNFDIGEMLQSVGDSLSGAAAQAGVDLVLFHGDVGMKHVMVKGDESCISFTLSHIIRQVINTARKGDTIEIGLSISSTTESSPEPTVPSPNVTPTMENAPTGRISHLDDILRCTFDIAHKFASSDRLPGESSPESSPSPPVRLRPNFNSLFLKRALPRLSATFNHDLTPKMFSGRGCEFAIMVDQGMSVPPSHSSASLDSIASELVSESNVASEPTLEELAQFAETLRGKKAVLFANSKGSFAHHLTSYLTAWGMDVSHVASEPGGERNIDAGDTYCTSLSRRMTEANISQTISFVPCASPPGVPPQIAPVNSTTSSQPLSFILIDDDVNILRERLQKLRAEQGSPLQRKRPSLASNHRPRSSPQVARAMGFIPSQMAAKSPVVIVHFTSLNNFKSVKDVIQSALASLAGSSVPVPEVLIIPKPVGPRRFLTALHTAVTKPIVDPFFAPIATSPISPETHRAYSYFGSSSPTSGSKSSVGRPSGASRTNSDRSTRSPKETAADPPQLPPPSPLGMSDSMEYFSEAAVKLGASPSAGLVIQSPDGQPAGIFFHPRGKTTKSSSFSLAMERDRGQLGIPADRNRRASDIDQRRSPQGNISFAPLHTASRSPRIGGAPIDAREGAIPSVTTLKNRGAISSQGEDQAPAVDAPIPTTSTPRRPGSIEPHSVRKGSTSPISPLNEGGSAAANVTPRRPGPRRSTGDKKPATPPAAATKGKGIVDAHIVPPISVLIVDDNPINQTILSTFMKKKKIKFDVAKNGEEAVQKWQTGGFHLILMDIQMPVMDGIQATKEIRRMEKQNAAAGYPSTPHSEEGTPVRTPSDQDSRPSSSPYRSAVIIVALTASSLPSDRVAALGAGCNDFLTKPVSLRWLNNKIIEWGSIKALQMWADLRPEAVKSMYTGQVVQAQNVAKKLHVPEGRRTPTGSPSRSSSASRTIPPADTSSPGTPLINFVRPPTFSYPMTHEDSLGSRFSADSFITNPENTTTSIAPTEHDIASPDPVTPSIEPVTFSAPLIESNQSPNDSAKDSPPPTDNQPGPPLDIHKPEGAPPDAPH